MNKSVEKIGDYIIKKYINPSIEQMNYVLRKDDKDISSALFITILGIVKNYLFRDDICKEHYNQLMQQAFSIMLADDYHDFERERNFIKLLNIYLIDNFQKKYDNLISYRFEEMKRMCSSFIADNYNYVDYIELFKNIIKNDKIESIIEKIIFNISDDIKRDLYYRIENELYDYNSKIYDPTIYY